MWWLFFLPSGDAASVCIPCPEGSSCLDPFPEPPSMLQGVHRPPGLRQLHPLHLQWDHQLSPDRLPTLPRRSGMQWPHRRPCGLCGWGVCLAWGRGVSGMSCWEPMSHRCHHRRLSTRNLLYRQCPGLHTVPWGTQLHQLISSSVWQWAVQSKGRWDGLPWGFDDDDDDDDDDDGADPGLWWWWW